MKKLLPILLGGFVFLNGCNDKPEVEPATTFDLTVYPNPATQYAIIAVRNQNNKSFTLKVFDTTGDLLLNETGNQGPQDFMLQLSDKPKGKYQVILKTDKAVLPKP